MKRIFIVGEQRSGSNLLRLMLDQVPGLACPHPPHILKRMYPLLDRYGDLGDDGNLVQLANDVVELVRRNPVAWDGFDVSGELVAARCRSRSLIGVYEAVMDDYAISVGADIGWVCKSMQNIRWFADLEEHFERALYLHIYRDPRDVAASFRKAVVGSKHPFIVASKWAELQELCLEARSVSPGRFFSVSYESLVSAPRETAKRICGFLKIEFSESMLAFHRSREANKSAKASSLWENLSKPVMSGNSGKFHRELTSRQVALVEKAALGTMRALGYSPSSSVSDLKSIETSPAEMARFEREDREISKTVLSTMSEEDRSARSYQAELLELVRGRPVVGKSTRAAV